MKIEILFGSGIRTALDLRIKIKEGKREIFSYSLESSYYSFSPPPPPTHTQSQFLKPRYEEVRVLGI